MPSKEYMREYRRTAAGQIARQKQKQRDKAKQQAFRTLALRHKSEFDTLFKMYLADIEREEQDHAKENPVGR